MREDELAGPLACMRKIEKSPCVKNSEIEIYTKETDLSKYDVTYSTGMTKPRMEFDVQLI
jgi:hypothetical protein